MWGEKESSPEIGEDYFFLFFESFAVHEQVNQWLVLEVVLLLIPETKVGIVAPSSPGNIKLVEYS
jgi:hypothetical protein